MKFLMGLSFSILVLSSNSLRASADGAGCRYSAHNHLYFVPDGLPATINNVKYECVNGRFLKV